MLAYALLSLQDLLVSDFPEHGVAVPWYPVPTNVLASVCYHTNPTDAECVSQSHQYLDLRYLSTMFVQKDQFFVEQFLQIHWEVMLSGVLWTCFVTKTLVGFSSFSKTNSPTNHSKLLVHHSVILYGLHYSHFNFPYNFAVKFTCIIAISVN